MSSHPASYPFPAGPNGEFRGNYVYRDPLNSDASLNKHGDAASRAVQGIDVNALAAAGADPILMQSLLNYVGSTPVSRTAPQAGDPTQSRTTAIHTPSHFPVTRAPDGSAYGRVPEPTFNKSSSPSSSPTQSTADRLAKQYGHHDSHMYNFKSTSPDSSYPSVQASGFRTPGSTSTASSAPTSGSPSPYASAASSPNQTSPRSLVYIPPEPKMEPAYVTLPYVYNK